MLQSNHYSYEILDVLALIILVSIFLTEANIKKYLMRP